MIGHRHHRRAAWCAALALALPLVACSKRDATTAACANGKITTVGEEGGEVQSSDAKVSLRIPAGALERSVEICIRGDSSQTPSDVGSALPFHYILEPDGLRFAKSALIDLKIDGQDLRDLDLESAVPMLGLVTTDAAGQNIETLENVRIKYRLLSRRLEVTASINHFSNLFVSKLGVSLKFLGNTFNNTMQVGDIGVWNVGLQVTAKGVADVVTISVEEAEHFVLPSDVFTLLASSAFSGANHPRPYNARQGNTFKTMGVLVNAKVFVGNPQAAFTCVKPGQGELGTTVIFQRLDQPSGRTARASMTVTDGIRCVNAQMPGATKATVGDAASLRRSADGEVAVAGKGGVAFHDSKTLELKDVRAPGRDAVGSFDVEKNGKKTMVVERGNINDLVDKNALIEFLYGPGKAPEEDIGIGEQLNWAPRPLREARPACPPGKIDSCTGSQAVVIDGEGGVHLINPNTGRVASVEGLPPEVSSAIIVDLGNGKWNGLAVTRSGGLYYGSDRWAGPGMLVGAVAAPLPPSVDSNAKIQCSSSGQACLAIAGPRATGISWRNADNVPVIRNTVDLPGPVLSFEVVDTTGGSAAIATPVGAPGFIWHLSFDQEGRISDVKKLSLPGCLTKGAVFNHDGSGVITLCQTPAEGRGPAQGRLVLQPLSQPGDATPRPEAPTRDAGADVPMQVDARPDAGTAQPRDRGVDAFCSLTNVDAAIHPSLGMPGSVVLATPDECREMYRTLPGNFTGVFSMFGSQCTTDADCKNPQVKFCCPRFGENSDHFNKLILPRCIPRGFGPSRCGLAYERFCCNPSACEAPDPLARCAPP